MAQKIIRILITSPHCRPDWIPFLGKESQGGQTVVMNKLSLALTKVNPSLRLDLFTRLQDNDYFAKTPISFLDSEKRVRLIRLPAGPTDRYIRKEILYGQYINQFVQEILKFTKKENIDYQLLHGHYADGWETVFKLSKFLNRPYFVTTHSLGRKKQQDCLQRGMSLAAANQKFNFKTRIASEDQSLAKATIIFVLSSEEKRFLLKHYPTVKKEKIAIFPNGIDPSQFNFPQTEGFRRRWRQEFLKLLPNDLVFIIPSRQEERKGQLPALIAWRQFLLQSPPSLPKLKLVLLATQKENDYSRQLIKFAQQHQLEKSVIFLPPLKREESLRSIFASDIVLLPSQEYFSIAMLEAMYLGRVVVCSRFSGAKDVIKSGENGFLINHQKESDLVRSYQTTATLSSAQREAIGHQANGLIKQKYTWAKLAKKLNEIYAKFIF